VRLKKSDGHLESRVTPLNMSGEEFAKIGHQLIDDLAALIDGVRDRPLGKGESPEVVRDALRAEASLPEGGTDAAALIKQTTDLLIDHSLYNSHPRFFGYIQGPAAPVGILADLLASAVNPNLGGWMLSPMASEIEDQVTRWIAEFVGFPSGGDGVLTSGGNVANMLGFWASRAAKAPWDVRRGGMHDPQARPLRIYCARGTHTWVQKAADLSGLGSDSIRWIDTDDQDRMLIDELETSLEEDVLAGDCPLMIVGTGGSVSTGAVDQLPRIGVICDRFVAWFHVDGAYGAFAAAAANASDVPEDLCGLALADSVALDPHKWLYAPLEVGCILVRDPDALMNTFAYRPDYYYFQADAKNFFERGIQNSRGFRALKVWMQLKHVGRAGYVRMISEDIQLARRFVEVAADCNELEVFGTALSIATYRFVPSDLATRVREPPVLAYLNELNEAIQGRMELGGEAFVSNAVLGEAYVLRMCVVNFRTTLEDVVALTEISERLGREADAEIRPDVLR
jgi:aromatic-L-amino-acid decarboxylase